MIDGFEISSPRYALARALAGLPPIPAPVHLGNVLSLIAFRTIAAVAGNQRAQDQAIAELYEKIDAVHLLLTESREDHRTDRQERHAHERGVHLIFDLLFRQLRPGHDDVPPSAFAGWIRDDSGIDPDRPYVQYRPMPKYEYEALTRLLWPVLQADPA